MDELKNFKEITKEELKLASLGINLEKDRQVFDIDQKKKEENFRLSQSDTLKSTETEMKTIADILENRELHFDEETRAKLELRQDRNMSHILINSRKVTGDSAEMKEIKQRLLILEEALAQRKDVNIPISAEELAAIENQYMMTITSCQHYLSVKTTHTGASRYAMVFNKLNSLTKELSLISRMKELADEPGMEGFFKVGSLSDLILSAKFYDFSRQMLAKQTEDNEDVAATDDKVTLEEETKEVIQTKLPDDVMASMDTHAQNIVHILTMMKRPHDLASSPGDDYANIASSLLKTLQSFPEGAYATYINSGTIGYQGKGFLRSSKDAKGKTVKANTLIGLRQTKAGNLFIKIGEFEQELPYSKNALLGSMTASILDNERTFGREVMDNSMDFIKDSVFSKYDPATVRNICLKYIANRTGLEPTRLHNLNTSSVRMLARYLMDDQISKDDILTVLEKDAEITDQMINGKETLELLSFREKNRQKLGEKVLFKDVNNLNANKASSNPDKEGPDGWTPNELEVKNLLADLIFSKDTWIADNAVRESDVRMRNVIIDNSYAFTLLASRPEVLGKVLGKMLLPKDFTDAVGESLSVITELVQISGYAENIKKAKSREEKQAITEKMLNDETLDWGFSALDIAIDKAINVGTELLTKDIAEKVDGVFKKEETNKTEIPLDLILKEPKERTDEDIKAGNDCLNDIIKESMKGDKGQGKFTKLVLKHYFSGVETIDKRAMIASAIRDCKAAKDYMTDEEQSAADASYIGGIFKGAGPLMQKMLQGMPLDGISEDLKPAFNAVKSKLMPIPKEIVEAQFLSMVERSNGAVSKIEVSRALGAASVGQAFLCKIYGPSIPEEGQEVVVKILRPDVRNRMMREKKIMLACASMTNAGMVATYNGQLARIEEELDLTIEARNVERGRVYDKSRIEGQERDAVSSMKLNTLIAPTTNSMVIEKSPGTTVDKYLDSLAEKKTQILDKLIEKDKDNKPKLDEDNQPKFYSTSYLSKTFPDVKAQLVDMISQAKRRQEHLIVLSQKWSEEGLFGSGFYHGDLHAGNIMIDDDTATVIDFGNATQLEPEQLGAVTKMIAAATIGEEGAFLDCFHELMKKDEGTEELWKQQLDEFRGSVKNYFALGSSGSTGQRIAAVLMRAQELGLELPSAIFNFSQCQLRLQNTINDFNAQIASLESLLNKIPTIQPQLSMKLSSAMKNNAAEHPSVNDPIGAIETYSSGMIDLNKYSRYFNEDLAKTSVEDRQEFDSVYQPEKLENARCLEMDDFVEKVRTKVEKGESVKKLLESSSEIGLFEKVMQDVVAVRGKKRDEIEKNRVADAQEKKKELIRVLADKKSTKAQIDEILGPYFSKMSFPRALKAYRELLDSDKATNEEKALAAANVKTIYSDTVKTITNSAQNVDCLANMGAIGVVVETTLFETELYSDEKFASEMAPYIVTGKDAENDELTKAYRDVMILRRLLREDKFSKEYNSRKASLQNRFMYYYLKKQRQEINQMLPELKENRKYLDKKPKDFIDAMGDVISENVVATISRLGFWGWWHNKELMAIEK